MREEQQQTLAIVSPEQAAQPPALNVNPNPNPSQATQPKIRSKSKIKIRKRPASSPWSKVAALPKTIRHRISELIIEGVPDPEILSRLRADAAGLTVEDLVAWKQRCHAQWLREQERLQRLRTLREFALEIMKDENSRLKEAGIEIAAAQIYELLADFDPLSLREKLDGDPAQFARIVSALARLSDGGLKYERYRAEVAERKAEIERDLAKSGPGGLTAEAVAEIEKKVRLL